jgi:hypothetical protein
MLFRKLAAATFALIATTATICGVRAAGESYASS